MIESVQAFEEVRRWLHEALERSDAKLSFINTRLILRTGVDLMKPDSPAARRPNAVALVHAALKDMGFVAPTRNGDA